MKLLIILLSFSLLDGKIVLEPRGRLIPAAGYGHLGIEIDLDRFWRLLHTSKLALKLAKKRISPAEQYEWEILWHSYLQDEELLATVEQLLQPDDPRRGFFDFAALGLSIFNQVELIEVQADLSGLHENDEIIAHRVDEMATHVNSNMRAIVALNSTLHQTSNTVINLQKMYAESTFLANVNALVTMVRIEVDRLFNGVQQLLAGKIPLALFKTSALKDVLHTLNNNFTSRSFFPIITHVRQMVDLDASFWLENGRKVYLLIHVPYSRVEPLEMYHVRPLPFVKTDHVFVLAPSETLIARSTHEGTYYSLPENSHSDCRKIRQDLICQVSVLQSSSSSCISQLSLGTNLTNCPVRPLVNEEAFQLNETYFYVFAPNEIHFQFHCLQAHYPPKKVLGLQLIEVKYSCTAHSAGLVLIPRSSFRVNHTVLIEPIYEAVLPKFAEIRPLVSVWPAALSPLQEERLIDHLHASPQVRIMRVFLIIIVVTIVIALVLALAYFLYLRRKAQPVYATVSNTPPIIPPRNTSENS